MIPYPEAGLPSWEPVVAVIWLEHGVSHDGGIQRVHTKPEFEISRNSWKLDLRDFFWALL